MSLTTPTSFTQRTLEKIRIGVAQEISINVLLDTKIDVYAMLGDRLRVQVTGYVWGEHLGKKSVSWPADWVQHFKQRWFPRWALKLWPVKIDTKEFDCKAMYPEYKAIFPTKVSFAMFDIYGDKD